MVYGGILYHLCRDYSIRVFTLFRLASFYLKKLANHSFDLEVKSCVFIEKNYIA